METEKNIELRQKKNRRLWKNKDGSFEWLTDEEYAYKLDEDFSIYINAYNSNRAIQLSTKGVK